jgi:hypothetical protein
MHHTLFATGAGSNVTDTIAVVAVVAVTVPS